MRPDPTSSPRLEDTPAACAGRGLFASRMAGQQRPIESLHQWLRQRAHRIALTLLLTLLAALPTGAAWAQQLSEPQLKASYLINFFKYIEWPDSPESLTLCLFGREELSPYLRDYEGRLVAGRPLRIRKITQNDQLAGCQQLYIPDQERERVAQLLSALGSRAVLTVSDKQEFAHDGGGITLETQDGRIVFDINTEIVHRAGLRMASPMLRLARQVYGIRR